MPKVPKTKSNANKRSSNKSKFYTKNLVVISQGIFGNDVTKRTAGCCEIVCPDEKFRIKVDCYEGDGYMYRPREKNCIEITLPNGTIKKFNTLEELIYQLNK